MATSLVNIHNLSANDSEDSDSTSSDNTVVESSDSKVDDPKHKPIWTNFTLGLRKLSFTKENKLLVYTPRNNKPIDWHLLLLDDIFLEFIFSETNKYALELFCGPSTSEQSGISW